MIKLEKKTDNQLTATLKQQHTESVINVLMKYQSF